MRNQIITGDARVLAKQLSDESIDMVFTDPPYEMAMLPLYEFAVMESARVLKPGSWAFLYGGWLAREIYNLMCDKGLDYFGTIALRNKGGNPRWWSKKLFIGFKPVYVFTKGPPLISKWQCNLSDGDEMEKRYHKWGQGIGFAVEKIEMFTNPGDVVLDYFCGGGSTPVACKITGRDYIAFELDPETAEIARERVADTNPPLFIMEPEQLRLT